MANSIKEQAERLLISRRGFLAASAGGSLVLAFSLPGFSGSAQAAVAAQRFAPTVWFEVDATGAVLVNIAKAEMGQHVGTALARIVAEELGADWNRVRIKHVDSDPRWGYMVTGGSWSVFTSFNQLSQAGAAGRMVLQQAGAEMLGVPAEQCAVADGKVSAAGRSVSFAEIVARGGIDQQFTAEQLAALPVKPATDRRLLGKPITALDIPEKSTGTAMYGIDAERPGMVYGRPLLPPTRYGSSVRAVDDSDAQSIKGYRGFEILKDPSGTLQGWVVVLGDNFWAASQAADRVKVDWQAGPTASISEADILARGAELAGQGGGPLWLDDGDFDAAESAAASQFERSYRTSTALHFTLEPANALAEFVDGRWHIHTGNQWQSLILPVLAAALEVEEQQVVLRQHYLGGGFGRRLWGDYCLPAALAAKAIGKPVKVVFTREDDSRMDCVRSPSVQRFRATLDAQGEVTGIAHDAVAGWPTLTMAPGFMPDGVDGSGKVDPFSANGSDHWYSLPAHRVRAVNNDLAQKTFLPGWLRAVGPGWIAWGVESFMDELAHAAGQDPVQYRLAMLDASGKQAGEAPNSVGGAARLAAVLREVAQMSGWGRQLPEGQALGVAVAAGQERNMPTWVACVAHVQVDKTSGQVKLHKLWQAIDCGTVIHPGGALAQAEGAALWGVSLALHEGTRFVDGQVADRNLDRYTPLRMADTPELEIRFVESQEFPMGMGEPPLIPVAPAIGNAVFAASGARVRDLPIRPQDVLAALKA